MNLKLVTSFNACLVIDYIVSQISYCIRFIGGTVNFDFVKGIGNLIFKVLFDCYIILFGNCCLDFELVALNSLLRCSLSFITLALFLHAIVCFCNLL
jgi:hypothetical protein